MNWIKIAKVLGFVFAGLAGVAGVAEASLELKKELDDKPIEVDCEVLEEGESNNA